MNSEFSVPKMRMQVSMPTDSVAFSSTYTWAHCTKRNLLNKLNKTVANSKHNEQE